MRSIWMTAIAICAAASTAFAQAPGPPTFPLQPTVVTQGQAIAVDDAFLPRIGRLACELVAAG